jgi:hypothetical protein
VSPIERFFFTATFLSVTAYFLGWFVAILARRRPPTRPWAAAGFGSVGLLALGAFPALPLEDADRLLGGTNGYYFVMVIAAGTAMWLLVEAITDVGHVRWRSVVLLVAWVLAYGIAFAAIDRGPTSPKFSHEEVGQLPMILCGGIYLFGLVVLFVRLIVAVSTYPRRAYWPFTVGAALIIIAASSELAGMLVARYVPDSSAATDVLYLVFTPGFFGGILLLIAGLCSFPLRRTVRDVAVDLCSRHLVAMLTAREISAPPMSFVREGTDSEKKLVRLMTLQVRVTDAVMVGAMKLNTSENGVVRRAERLIDGELRAAGTGWNE